MAPKPSGSKPKHVPCGKRKLTKTTPAKPTKTKKQPTAKPKIKRQCGLCGKTKDLTKTDCCKNWICDDEENYDFYTSISARKSCYRNHLRYTLCSSHYHEDHQGSWQDCKKCKDGLDTPNYVYFGTNEHNFEVLKNPEKVSITCSHCGFTGDTIVNFIESYSSSEGKQYKCLRKDCKKYDPAPKENRD